MPGDKRPFIGTLTSFEGVFPQLEDAVVDYTEFDFGEKTRESSHSMRHDGPRIRCGNSRCQRGGYNLQWTLEEVIRKGQRNVAIDLSCHGDEGTPKGKRIGQSCLHSIKGHMTIKYKEGPEQTKT